MRLYRRKLRRKYFIIKRMQKISKTIKKKNLNILKSYIFKCIKKKQNINIIKCSFKFTYFVKRFLSKNDIIIEHKVKDLFLNKVYLTKKM